MSTFPPNPLACFWQNNPHKLHDHRSTEDLPTHSDVVIIGAGYAGVSTAWHLLHNHPNINSITILEARGACSGATGRNGGHLRPDLYGHIPTYIDRAGPEAAAEIAEFEIAHVQAIKKLVESEQIDCDFTLTRTIDVWCNEQAAEGARKVYERMKGHGFAYMDDVDFHTGKNVEGVCLIPNCTNTIHTNAIRSAASKAPWPVPPTRQPPSGPTSSSRTFSPNSWLQERSICRPTPPR
jgi:hypothetical protein